MKTLKASKHRIQLSDGRELHYNPPFKKPDALALALCVPEEWKTHPLEIEIGPGKGEFLAARAARFKDRFFVGIDKRQDRVQLTQNKLSGRATSHSQALTGRENHSNWKVIQEDARRFVEAGLPPLSMLHIYHPDPWPKARHHKNRFFRSPDAKEWTRALVPHAELRISTDHAEYFEEIVDIVNSWTELGQIEALYSKTASCGAPLTHFEGIFLKKNEPVYKLIFRRKAIAHSNDSALARVLT